MSRVNDKSKWKTAVLRGDRSPPASRWCPSPRRLYRAPRLAVARPNANFVTQLIANRRRKLASDQRPLRRAAPADALLAYRAFENRVKGSARLHAANGLRWLESGLKRTSTRRFGRGASTPAPGCRFRRGDRRRRLRRGLVDRRLVDPRLVDHRLVDHRLGFELSGKYGFGERGALTARAQPAPARSAARVRVFRPAPRRDARQAPEQPCGVHAARSRRGKSTIAISDSRK